MTITAAFPLSMASIASEYGGSLPFSLRSVLGKPGLPTSGAVSFNDCLGKSAPATGSFFTPDGGTSSGSPLVIDNASASETIACNAAATWTWTVTGAAGVGSPASGGSATSWSGSVTGAAGVLRVNTYTLTAVSAGVTRYYSVKCTVDNRTA